MPCMAILQRIILARSSESKQENRERQRCVYALGRARTGICSEESCAKMVVVEQPI